MAKKETAPAAPAETAPVSKPWPKQYEKRQLPVALTPTEMREIRGQLKNLNDKVHVLEDEKKSSRVRTITIGRLYNLGNYEHVRYEIAVDVGDSDPVKAFEDVCSILHGLNPKSPVDAWDLQRAKKVLAKPASDLTELETAGLGDYRKIIGDHEAWEALRAESRLKLAALGGAAVHVDAKQTWEQDDL